MPSLRKFPVMSLVVLLAATSSLAAAFAAPLAAERWNKRIVLIFADGENDRAKRQADALLADRNALSVRDMLLIRIVGDTVATPFGEMRTTPKASELRKAYDVPESAPFTVILVGKDGGEKLRRREPVAAKDVLGLIDSMPMRRREADGGS